MKTIGEYAGNHDVGVIITPIYSDVQQEIVAELKHANIDNYYVFWR